MGTYKYLGIALLLLPLTAAAQTSTITALPDPGVQSPTTMNNNFSSLDTAVDTHDGRLTNLEALIGVQTDVVRFITGANPTTNAAGEAAVDLAAWGAGRDALEFYDGTASTYLIATLASDTPANGECPKFNTGGTITWESCAGTGTLTGIAADAGGTATGATITTAGGTNGIDTSRSVDTITFNFDSTEVGADAFIDSQVSNTLTSSLFVGSGSSTTAVDLATAEVAGTLTDNKGGTGISALGSGVATFLGTASSANLRGALSDESGSGAALFAGGAIGAATGVTAAGSDDSTLVATTEQVHDAIAADVPAPPNNCWALHDKDAYGTASIVTTDTGTLWLPGIAVTMTSFTCFADAGTIVNLHRMDGSGSPDLLTGDVVCDSNGEPGTIAGAEAVFDSNDYLDYEVVLTGGTTTLTFCVGYTIN